MKKTSIFILFLCVSLLSACTDKKAQSQSLEEFYKDSSIENVEKVMIQDGSTGKTIEITEKEQIDEFLSLIKDIYFTPQENQDGRVGWRYAITLYEGTKKFQFTLSQIGDTYYNSTPDIYPIIDDYYKKHEIE